MGFVFDRFDHLILFGKLLHRLEGFSVAKYHQNINEFHLYRRKRLVIE